MDHVSFPYRASNHLALLHVVAESGAWEKHGIEVDYNQHISSTDAHREVPTGEVEFVGGNHVSTYGYRARGDNWIYLGQTVNAVNHRLCVHPDSGIFGIEDLKEKKVVTRGSHPELNDWLFLKQRGLDVDRDDVEIINQLKIPKGQMDAIASERNNPEKWELVKLGEMDATFLMPPKSTMAEKAGLRVIEIEPLPMITFTTISSSQKFVERHPDVVEKFLKGLIEGIAFFKTNPDRTKRIIKERHTTEGALDDETVEIVYSELARLLEPGLYPSMAAINNVYQEALRQDKDARKVNPLALWDFHYIRQLEDSGFVKSLYSQVLREQRPSP